MNFNLCMGTPLNRLFSFSVPEDTKGIYVLVSGGLDSLTLLLLLLSVTADSRLPVVALTVDKADGSTEYAARIVNLVTASSGRSIVHRSRVNNDPEAYALGRLGWSVLTQIHDTLPKGWRVYGGMNKMAPDDIRPFSQRLVADYSFLVDVMEVPFLELHKPHLVDLLSQLDGIPLAKYTRSCTVNDVGECGNCYSCKERKWGFDYLSLPQHPTVPLE